MNCPTCFSKEIETESYCYHRLSFVQFSFRRPFPKKQPIHKCSDCGHLWTDTTYIDVRRFALPEVYHHPRYNLDHSQTQSEKYFFDCLKTVLRDHNITSVRKILDLRMLSGRTLEELKNTFKSTTCVGFDWHEVTCEWARTRYSHMVIQYPIGDPIERILRWIHENPEVTKSFDLIIQSQSILEFTKKPREFADLILSLLNQNGKWAIYEQFLDQFPKEVFLNELFDPWAKQYFSRNSVESIFVGKYVELADGFKTSTRRLILAKKSEKRFAPRAVIREEIIQKHPRFENTFLNKKWNGSIGRSRALYVRVMHKLDDLFHGRFGINIGAKLRRSKNPIDRRQQLNQKLVSKPIVDVLIVSCGRVEALEKTIWYFRRMINSDSRRFRFLIHDDYIDGRAEEHEICRKWINKSNIFDQIYFAEENQGISQSVNLLLSKLESDIYIHLEDDTVFLRPINFDPLYKIFEDYDSVNQIRFNRTENTPLFGSVSKIFGKYRARAFQFHDTILCMASLWSNQPNIARTNSPFTRLMATVTGRFHERIFNLEFSKHWLDPFDAYEKLGAFMYGPIGESIACYEVETFNAHNETKKIYFEDDAMKIDRFQK